MLVTGAAGNIGSYFCRHAHQKYELRLLERKRESIDEEGDLAGLGEVVIGDVDDLPFMKRACAGIDTVLHLAADPSPSATWDSLLPGNIVGTYNTFAAAKACGCRRVIYASSIHAVSGYPPDVQVKVTEPVNPGDLYGVTKCFGEALARYMAEKEGVSSVAIRIGGFQPPSTIEDPKNGLAMVDAWVSRRDLQQLIEKSIDAEPLTFLLVHGLSNNRFKRLDISTARDVLGYEPQDDATEVNPHTKDLDLSEKVMAHSMADPGAKSGLRNQVS